MITPEDRIVHAIKFLTCTIRDIPALTFHNQMNALHLLSMLFSKWKEQLVQEQTPVALKPVPAKKRPRMVQRAALCRLQPPRVQHRDTTRDKRDCPARTKGARATLSTYYSAGKSAGAYRRACGRPDKVLTGYGQKTTATDGGTHSTPSPLTDYHVKQVNSTGCSMSEVPGEVLGQLGVPSS